MTQIEELTDIFKALSDPTRLKLVRLLYECSQKTAVCECISQRVGTHTVCHITALKDPASGRTCSKRTQGVFCTLHHR